MTDRATAEPAAEPTGTAGSLNGGAGEPARRRAGFTVRASCVLTAGATAVVAGLVLGEIDLVRAGVLALAVPLVSAVVVHRSQLRLANRRGVDRSQVPAGSAVTIQLTITNRSRLPTGALLLEDQMPRGLRGQARFVLDSLNGHESRTVSYRIPGLARGRYRAGPLRIRLGDPFRMIDLTRSFRTTGEFVVLPTVDQLAAGDVARSDEFGAGAGSHSVGLNGADDASTREYRVGDDLRKIHWRSSARTGALMVRQEERPWRSQRTVLLDLRAGAHAMSPHVPDGADPRTVSSLEWAVSAAASVGVLTLRSGRDVGLVADLGTPHARAAGTGGASDATHGLARFTDADRLLTQLAGAVGTPARDLESLSGALRLAVRDSSLVAVLGRVDPTSLRVLAEARTAGTGSAFALLLDVDSWAAPDLEPPMSDALHGAVSLLHASGWRVSVVRRGTPITAAWNALLAGGAAAPFAASALTGPANQFWDGR